LFGAAFHDGKATWAWPQAEGAGRRGSETSSTGFGGCRSEDQGEIYTGSEHPFRSEIRGGDRSGGSATAYEEDAITCSGCVEAFNEIVMT
ncbi:MAG: hypothetical protein WBX30_33550, partial [Stellaceae bacterium]